MNHIICSVYDTATSAYMRPFTSQSTGQAMRMFTDIATDPLHDVGKHPEDYALFQIANFDDQTGTIEPIVLKCLARAHEVLKLAAKPIDTKDHVNEINRQMGNPPITNELGN